MPTGLGRPYRALSCVRCRMAGVLRLPAPGRLVQRGAGLAAVRAEPAAVRAGPALLRGGRVWRGAPAAAAADLPVRGLAAGPALCGPFRLEPLRPGLPLMLWSLPDRRY